MKKELRNPFGKTYITIVHDPENNWIHNHWEGTLTMENVMQGATEVLRMMETTNCQFILNDNRAVTGSWNQANDWIGNVWMPQALQLGLRRFAHVVSPGLFGTVSAEEMLRRVGDRFEMRLFQGNLEAKYWLKAAQLLPV